jgi:hypothetical protein
MEESEEDKIQEQHFVEAHTMQKDAREETIVAKEKNYPQKCN